MIRRPSDRAESTQLSHLFGIAMTAVLITIILTGAADYVQNEREDVAQTQLETIGNRLAAEVERVDELGRQGGNATARMEVQATVAGENYDVFIGGGSTCVTGNFDSDRCLVLETLDESAQAKIPLNVSDEFTIEDEGSGVLRLTVDGDGSRGGTAAVVDRQLRIGVGSNFQGNQYGNVVDPTNRPPIARIDFSPGVPRSSDPVRFTAVDSVDPDGNIVTYKWDFNNDGSFEIVGEGPSVTRDLSAGRHTVTLQVVDNAPSGGATSNATVTLQVSGLAYDGNLDDSDAGPSGAVSFSVTNEWSETIAITQVMIRPKVAESEYPIELNNDCSGGDCPYDRFENGEVVVDGSNDVASGEADRDPDGDDWTEIPSDGVIVELEDPVTLFSGERARIWTGAFLGPGYSDLSGTEFDIGVRYEIELPPGAVDPHNSTVFTDVVGSPTIEEYRIETGGGFDGDQVDAVIVSDERLDSLQIDVGGEFDDTFDESDATSTKRPNGNWEHEIFLGTLEDGVVKANLTVARNDSVSAFETRGPKSINRSVAVLSGEYAWTNESDWNAALDQDGVVHASYGTNQPDEVRVGYSRFAPGLEGYWPFDGSPDDVSGSLDGSAVGVGTARGVYGSSSYTFDGDDYVEIGSQFGDIHTSTSSLSMWVKTSDAGDWYLDDAPGLTGYVDGYFEGLVWGWLDGEERLNVGSDYDGARSGDTIDDGQWHHVVMTFEEESGDDDVEVYVDGQRRSGEVEGDNDGDFSDIGRVVNGGNFTGRIDEVRSYDRVLDQNEVDELSDGEGSMTTGWKNGTDSLDLSNLVLQYGANVPYATDIDVTVEVVADNGTRLESDQIELRDGQDSVSVDGLGGGSASRYRLDIEFETDSPLKSPVLYQIGLREGT